eukprot:evm.model.scf_959.2 EVM.evm.TU.scf_959.2   scf_959:12170-17443(-)
MDYRFLLLACVLVQLGGWVFWRYDGWPSWRRVHVDGFEAAASGCDPPDIKSRVFGNVTEFDWNDPSQRGEVCRELQSYLADAVDQDDPQPVLIRHAIEWPALWRWNFTHILNLNVSSDVVISPSYKFYFLNPNKVPSFTKRFGAASVPSAMVSMSSSEAILRMQAKSNYSTLIYDKEHYYLRVDLTKDMEEDIDLNGGPFACLSDFVQGAPWKPGRPRLWVSPRGAISPLHYDKATSILAQVRGWKRLLLYDRADMEMTYPYNEGHLMARRGRVDPTDPDYNNYPKFRTIAAGQAVLGPGDVLFFPNSWPHYTDSLSPSISVTIRFDGV